MKDFKYVGAFDVADIVGVGTVKNGDTFSVSDEDAPRFLEQPSNFIPAVKAAPAPIAAPSDSTTEA